MSDPDNTWKLQRMREILAFFERHPEAEIPSSLYSSSQNEYVDSFDEVQRIRKAVGGKMDKVFTSWDVGFECAISEDVTYRFTTNRSEVCEKVVVGTEVIPAREATPERVVDKYEWVCPDSFLAKFE